MTCVWEPDPACLGDAWDNYTDEDRDRALMLATSSLQMLTYNRVGTCPITVRPCPSERRCLHAWSPYVGLDGLWRNNCGCGVQCGPLSEVDLPGPVGYVEQILVDGQPLDLDSGDFRLDNGHLLVWQGSGPSPIPETQDLNKPDSEVGTWSVTYSQSYPVAQDGRIAVARLALEFAKACSKVGKCSLPRGVTNVVRSGVTFTIEAGLFPNGLTGLDVVDEFILKWAPAGSPSRNSVVFDPRKPPMRVVSALPRRTGGSL